ncbi:MAG: formate dehydrogenase accessory protein FdhE [Coriobacteriia bacterium]|nr:formate dehydrogenase accessory protein FdhE [Coriobacteriia bacterium]
MTTDLARAVEHYLGIMDESGQARLRFAEKVWAVQDDIAQSSDAGDDIDAEQAKDCLATGQPLFLLARPNMQIEAFADAAHRIAEVVAAEAGLPEEAGAALRELDFATLATQEQLDAALEDVDAFVADASEAASAASEGSLTPEMVRFVVASALTPLLRRRSAEALAALEAFDWRTWSSGSCPVCGAPAAIGRVLDEGELKGGRRVLWCSLCDAEWEYDRVRCARCGTRNHSKLHYMMNEEDHGHRVHACEDCQGYIKVAFERDLGLAAIPRVEDVATLELDALAHARGYTPLGNAE